MPKAIVLGGGMVGSVMAADLAADASWQVAIADRSPAALDAASKRSGGRVKSIECDLNNVAAVNRLIEPFDIVLGALASRIGFQTLRAVIEAGRNYCDISFFAEDALELDALAKSRGVTAVVDCGVAPGMSHMLAGYAAAQLDACESIEIYVGGLPREPRWPFQYKAAFSPHDVIEEYVRPSRLVEKGRIVERPALSEPERIDFPGVGELEAFNTDGLRSLVRSMKVPFMKEKTLRYPGHIELMRVFRETGLFSHNEVSIGAARVRPVDLISALMFPMWTYEEGEADLTVMRVIAQGRSGGKTMRYQWDLLDFYDPATRTTSMARTTAFPCAIVARMIASGEVRMPGVIPPERIGQQPGMLEAVLQAHEHRGVRYRAATTVT